MEAFSALLALCARNSPHKSQWRGALMFSLICAFNKRLSKQSWGWWFETLSRSLWRIWNVQELWWIYIQLSISLTTFRKTVFFYPCPYSLRDYLFVGDDKTHHTDVHLICIDRPSSSWKFADQQQPCGIGYRSSVAWIILPSTDITLHPFILVTPYSDKDLREHWLM